MGAERQAYRKDRKLTLVEIRIRIKHQRGQGVANL